MILFSLAAVILASAVAAIILRERRAAVLSVRSQRTKAPEVPRVAEPPRFVIATGKMQPVRRVKISPEVSGEIVELPVKEGQQVKQGDLLLKIKPDFYVADRDQAEGNYKSALAGVEMAKANLEQAEDEYKRNQDLFRSGLVSQSAFEGAKTAYEVAKAQLTNADGQLEMAHAALARAQYDLDKTTILSPISGTVTKLNSQVGERVVGTATMAGTEVMTIADLNEMEARVEVSEADIAQLSCGERVQLEASAFGGQVLTGTVTEIATSCNSHGLEGDGHSPGTSLFEVRIRLWEKEPLRPGMTVTAKFPTPPQMHRLTRTLPVESKRSG